MAECQDEIICDLAETYHILNYEELSPELVAVLLIGLRDGSRVKMKLSDIKVSYDRMIQAKMADDLAFIAWSKTKAAQTNEGRPSSIYQMLLGRQEEKECESYDSPEAFFEAWHSRVGD